jgi:hypothetical protein
MLLVLYEASVTASEDFEALECSSLFASIVNWSTFEGLRRRSFRIPMSNRLPVFPHGLMSSPVLT